MSYIRYLKELRRKARELAEEHGILYDVHHKHPRSRKKSYSKNINDPENLTILETDIHRAWHKIVGNRTPPEAAALLTEKFISPDYYLVAIPRKKTPSKKRKKRYCVDCQCEVLVHIPLKVPD